MILVTGGTGLVGSHLLYQLVKSNNKVRATYRRKKTFHTKVTGTEKDLSNLNRCRKKLAPMFFVCPCVICKAMDYGGNGLFIVVRAAGKE